MQSSVCLHSVERVCTKCEWINDNETSLSPIRFFLCETWPQSCVRAFICSLFFVLFNIWELMSQAVGIKTTPRPLKMEPTPFANVISVVTKFTAVICVTTNNPWVRMIDKLWVIICHILQLFLYASSPFILKQAETLSTGTRDDSWQRHMRGDIILSQVKRFKLFQYKAPAQREGKSTRLFIPLGRCGFDLHHQLISAFFFHFGYLHYHYGRYCFERLSPNSTLQLKTMRGVGDACARSLNCINNRLQRAPCIDHSRHPGSQLCAGLFSNSRHWSLKVSTRRKSALHDTRGKRGSARGAISCSQEHWGSDRQSTWREREKSEEEGGGGDRNTKEGRRWRRDVYKKKEGEGKAGHYPNGSLCPIYPSHAAIPPRPRHKSFNWPSTQCLLKHSASLEKGSAGECGKLSHAGNIWWKSG